ncbi:MAG: UvrD-helicase domain-containing protein [bacterium]|nr:UvrD-helicase domain-containing protein [bacterium]
MSDQLARDTAITNHNTTLLVEAGAGTGKTTLLIERICSLIDAGVKAEKIAAVTFTVKAAGEMKERLRKALQQRSHSPLAEQALRDLDRMLINTIHGLASELLRALPVEAKLPPGFAAQDALQQDVARDEFLSRWLKQKLNTDIPAALSVAEELGMRLRSTDDKRSVATLFAKLNTISTDISRVTVHDERAPSLDEILAGLRSHFSALRMAAATCADETDRYYVGLRSLLQWSQQQPTSLVTVAGVRWLNAVPKTSYGSQNNWGGKAAFELVKQAVGACRDALTDAREALVTLVVQDIVNWISEAVREFRETIPETGQVGFDDLLSLCRDMLKESRIARSYFKRRFEYLHIDEFQDTDPMQVEILFFLAEEMTDFGDDWQTLKLKPGKLFIVGDPKQSIYGFRGADVRIYDRVAERIADTGLILNITRNFRSRPVILAEVNAVFAQAMTRPVGGTLCYQALEPTRVDASSFPALELLTPPLDYQIAAHSARTATRAEAAAIADHLLALRTRKELQSWSEAAILMRESTHLSKLQDALTARDIPFISFLTESYVGRVEIESALTLLSALANPQNTVATIGVLRSPWFAISDDELFRHKYSGQSFVYTDMQSPDTPVGAELAQLKRWHTQSVRSSTAELFEQIMNECPFEIHFGLKSEGPQRVQNLATLGSLISRLEACGVIGLRAIVARLFEMTKLAQNTELEARDKHRQAVQLLTLHKAKGLEFPIVYLFRMRDKSAQHNEWILHKSLDGDPHQLAASFGDKKDGWRTASAAACFERLDSLHKSEEQRLQYVGMTRARDRLIIPLGWAYKKEVDPTKHVPEVLRARFYDNANQRISVEGTHAALVTAEHAIDSEFRPYRPQMAGLDAPAADSALVPWRNWQARRDVRLASLAATPRKPDEPHAAVDWPRLHAQRVGTAVHAALERVAKTVALDSALRFAEQRFALTDSELADVSQLVNAAASSHLFTSELPTARRVFTELPIIAHNAAYFVDLLFQNHDGKWIVVDFKTDDVARDQTRMVAERDHKQQLSDYAVLFEQLSGAPPAELRLFFLRPNEVVIL